MTKAIRLQKPFDAKGRGSPIADALRWQTPFDGKGEALEGKEWIVRLEQANILSSHNHSSLGMAGLEDVALPENLGRIEDVAADL